MPLVKVNDLLRHATENHYGVAAVNVCNYETIKWVAEAAGRERIPVIIQFYPGFEKYIALKHVAAIAKEFAEKSEVPIGVHLDHSAGYGIAVGGVRDGFPSVMVDGSALPYEENVALTAAVVQAAGVFNVDVEAELGHVGSGANVDDIVNADHYTNVEQAVEFVERTGCGSLAVAVGNAHGAYVQTPNLDFERIAALRKALPIPLVLHGCSDIPHEQLQESVRLGMSKFNIATEYFRACYASVEKQVAAGEAKGNLFGLMNAAAEDAIDVVTESLASGDDAAAKSAVEMTRSMDQMERDIENRCLRLLLQQQPVARDLRTISAAMKMVTDLQRIGDQCAHIAEISLLLKEQKQTRTLADIRTMSQKAGVMVKRSIFAYVNRDTEAAQAVIALDDEVDALFRTIKGELVELIAGNRDEADQAIDLIIIAKYLERIADHAVNIAQWAIFCVTGEILG